MKLKFLLISILFAVPVIFGQSFTSSADKTTVGENERFHIYFSFEGGGQNDLSDFRPPRFEGVKVLSGPNPSTNMQIINGQVSQSITYSYIVQAEKAGKYTVGSASVKYKNQKFTTRPFKLIILKAGTRTQSGQTTGGYSNDEIAQNLFIRAIPDRREVYRGEQVTVTYKLYTRLNIESPQISKMPKYNGFWAEDLEQIKTINFAVEMYNGQRFRSAVLKKVALFPTQSGELEVTPFELDVPVRIKKRSGRNDFFDDFFSDSFFGRTETIEFTAKSNTLKIKAKPLPTTGAPGSFNGVVGQFRFNASINENEVEVNDAVSIKMDITGTGNLKLVNLPELDLPPGFEVYDPKTSENISRKGKIAGSKRIEYLIVPRIPGRKEINPVEFSYFDPVAKKYVTHRSKPFSINVIAGKNAVIGNVSGYSKEDVKLLSEDIRFIKTSTEGLVKVERSSILPGWFWPALLAPFIAFLAVLGIKKRQDKLSGNVRLQKFKKAEKAARNRLKTANKAAGTGDSGKFFSEIYLSLTGYLEDKLDISKAEFTIDRAAAELADLGVEAGLIEKIRKITEKCEFIRFAPQQGTAEAETEMYKETLDVIVKIENSNIGGKRK